MPYTLARDAMRLRRFHAAARGGFHARLCRDAMRDFVAIPYTLRVIPCQAFGLDKKDQVEFRLGLFLACPKGFEPSTFRVGV